jgi:hypothetical protein
MRDVRFLAVGLALSVVAAPALAQLSPGGMAGAPGVGAGAAPQPRVHTPDIAPPALPGAGNQAPLATGPKMQKPSSGNPTQDLFAAVNSGDYNSAQDAISRGADLNAQNPFGETPLDLSIALNRNTITFLLLQTRNELSAQGGGGPPPQSPALGKTAGSQPDNHKHNATAQSSVQVKSGPRININVGTGTPDPEAGFLGFEPKS